MKDKTRIVGERLRVLLDASEEQVSNEEAYVIWEKLEDASSADHVTVEEFGEIVKQQLPEFENITFAADNSDIDAILNDLKNRKT